MGNAKQKIAYALWSRSTNNLCIGEQRMSDVCNDKTRRARKQHKCCECYESIEVGQEYCYWSGIWECEPFDYKQCLNCRTLMKEASIYDQNEIYGDGVGFTELREWFLGGMCRDFQGEEYLVGMAKDVGVDPINLNKLLKIMPENWSPNDNN